MIIYIGADHRGFKLKETLKQFLQESGYTVSDLGNTRYEEGDDYPDFAKLVGPKVSADALNSRGIVICGSGVGVDVVANKFPNVRSALGFSSDQVMEARKDDDVNVLALASDFLEEDEAKKMVSVWLQTPFSGEERHKRRIEKIRQIDYPSH
ncbi:MAG: RpiB/LacA/LacB family sugar-phosphate isomerase [Candidatus Colwellbacteria bacterium]|nr:RpiB/LacA/LacB family sugar-phosphate isomerase [Candidatus Colwellbacteria bacterium]